MASSEQAPDALIVRPYTDDDAAAVAELYNKHRDAPNFVDRPLDAAMVRTELAERGTVVFLVAELAGEILGTVGMFRGSGRRAFQADEVFGDMFFLSPWIRGGAVAGRMFSQAFLALMPLEIGTIRLTVSPANDRALPLYRQLGCTLVGPAGAGEDGNIELVSHMPRLVARMQRDHADLIPASRRMTAGWRYQADGGTDRALGEHTETVSGRRVLRTALTLDGLVFRALLEPETGEILHSEADTGAGPGPDPVLPPARVAPPAAISLQREGPLIVVLDHGDGTVAVHHDRHVGPVLSQTWPVPGPPYPTGWRRTLRRELEIEPLQDASGGGWRVAERYGAGTLYRQTELAGGVLRQRVWWQGPAPAGRLRTILVGGLRSGMLFTGDRYVPAGRGLYPVDATEFGAAGMVLGADDEPVWWDPRTSLAVRVLRPDEDSSARLIAANELVLDLAAGTEYRIAFSDAEHPDDVVPGAQPRIAEGYRTRTPVISQATNMIDDPEPAQWSPAEVARRSVYRLTHRDDVLLLDPASGGVASWRAGGAPVLATPFPRSRVFAQNTSWRAGVWAGRHSPREEPRRGMGWGGPEPERDWSFDPADGRLAAPDLAWSIRPASDGIRLAAEAPAADGDGELVLWITPAAKSALALVPGAPGEAWLLEKAGAWQRWCDRLAIRLDDGRWLHAAAEPEPAVDFSPAAPAAFQGSVSADPAVPTKPSAAEILLRATPSGVLLALVTRHCAGDAGTAAWRLTVLDDADAAHRLLIPASHTELVLTGAAEQ